MEKHPQYTVLVPVFNSAATLKELNRRIHEVFDKLGYGFELIYIEDGGRDNSWDVLQEIFKEYAQTVRVIKLAKNYGQHNALFCGLNYASGDFIITIDDDLQIPPEEIEKLINRYKETESDLVYGYFRRKKHSFIRNLGSRFLKSASSALNDKPAEGSSFKLIAKHLKDQILKHHQNFVYIDELFLWYTDDISFVEVEHLKRVHTKSGYTTKKLFKMFFNITFYYTAVPLKIMTITGLLSSIISFIAALRYIYRWAILDVQPGYTSIIVAILFSASVILLSLGIIGEYLNRLYIVQNKKPIYSIKKVLKSS